MLVLEFVPMPEYYEMMRDAQEQEGYDHLFEEIGPEWARDHSHEFFDDATRRITEQRLTAFYIANPTLANSAISAVEYARKLMPARGEAVTAHLISVVEQIGDAVHDICTGRQKDHHAEVLWPIYAKGRGFEADRSKNRMP